MSKDVKRIDPPEVTDVDIAFPATIPNFGKFLDEAREEEKNDPNWNKWEKRFHELFFKGGKLNLNKSLDEEYLNRSVRYFRTAAGSFEPKHEHKTLVCAYILRSIES